MESAAESPGVARLDGQIAQFDAPANDETDVEVFDVAGDIFLDAFVFIRCVQVERRRDAREEKDGARIALRGRCEAISISASSLTSR